jgi:hypothetical protein
MKPSITLVPLALAAMLAGCAGQRASESEYVPPTGGPGYGPTAPGSDVNNVPGQRPPSAGAPAQGSSGTGVSGSGNAGTYGTGESGSAPASTGGSAGGASGASAGGASSSSADMQAMCALQQRLQAARSEQERQAILDQAMPGMTPDLRQQHLEMLRQQCH